MDCIRCKMVVRSELEKLGLQISAVDLGEVEIMKDISAEQLEKFRVAIYKSGLELIDDKKSIIVEKIKTLIIELVHYSEERTKINLSDYLSGKLNHNYKYLSNLFTDVKGTSIESYYLAHKIEKVKELLEYDELSLTQIADKLHYSSVAHLSSQFKKLTGHTPTHFKNLKHKRRQERNSV